MMMHSLFLFVILVESGEGEREGLRSCFLTFGFSSALLGLCSADMCVREREGLKQ